MCSQSQYYINAKYSDTLQVIDEQQYTEVVSSGILYVTLSSKCIYVSIWKILKIMYFDSKNTMDHFLFCLPLKRQEESVTKKNTSGQLLLKVIGGLLQNSYESTCAGRQPFSEINSVNYLIVNNLI